MRETLWKRAGEEAVRRCFDEYGISGWEKWDFRQFNLITGENGMGKTRLLKAVRDICEKAKIPCIYMDFTKIGKSSPTEENEENWVKLANPLLYSGPLPEEAYADFIPFLEKNADAFSRYLNQMSESALQTIMGERRDKINQTLMDNLGRELCFDRNEAECRVSSRVSGRKMLSLANAVAEMSPGERSIFYFALGLLCAAEDQRTSGEFVLIMDEPENHLHTRALLNLVNAAMELDSKKPRIRLLIASHSIFLVPLFRFEEIRLIENGAIMLPRGLLYQDVYDRLVGDSGEKGESLQEMLSSISRWTFCNYLTECLCEPIVTDTAKKTDPEMLKLLDVLKPFLQEDKQIRLLDYGGGSGRIAKCLQLRFMEEPEHPLIDRLQYDVYDPDPDYEQLPREPWMGRAYGEGDRNRLPKASYDVVVLYNVLHEIDVTEWKDTLNGILGLLDDGGILVFGERMVLSQGERPFGKSGYLVLGKNELSNLFGDKHVREISLPTGASEGAEKAEPKKDPTECYEISFPQNIKVTGKGVRRALKTLSARSLHEIKRVIDKGPVQEGEHPPRVYAFYCQQYINAEHALELLDAEAEETPESEGKLADYLHNYMGEELWQHVEERAKGDDEEAEECRRWLSVNPRPF